MKEKGIPQSDILDIDRWYISSKEGGKRNPTLSALKKLADALKVSVDELLK